MHPFKLPCTVFAGVSSCDKVAKPVAKHELEGQLAVAESSDHLFPDYLDSAHTVPFLVLRLNVISSTDMQNSLKQQEITMPPYTHCSAQLLLPFNTTE